MRSCHLPQKLIGSLGKGIGFDYELLVTWPIIRSVVIYPRTEHR